MYSEVSPDLELSLFEEINDRIESWRSTCIDKYCGVDPLELLYWKHRIKQVNGRPDQLPQRDQLLYVAFHDSCVWAGLGPTLTYREVLSSFAFQLKRRIALKRSGYACALNAKHTTQLEAHHNTYARLGYERVEDLIILCRLCHATYHHKLPTAPDDAQRRLPFIARVPTQTDNN